MCQQELSIDDSINQKRTCAHVPSKLTGKPTVLKLDLKLWKLRKSDPLFVFVLRMNLDQLLRSS